MKQKQLKALISCAFIVQLICAFVFANAKSRFSHEAAQFIFHLVTWDAINNLIIILSFMQEAVTLFIFQFHNDKRYQYCFQKLAYYGYRISKKDHSFLNNFFFKWLKLCGV